MDDDDTDNQNHDPAIIIIIIIHSTLTFSSFIVRLGELILTDSFCSNVALVFVISSVLSVQCTSAMDTGSRVRICRSSLSFMKGANDCDA